MSILDRLFTVPQHQRDTDYVIYLLQHLYERLNRLEKHLMATIEENLAAVEAALATSDAKLDAIKADIVALLQAANQPPAGLTKEQQDSFDALAAHASRIASSLDAVEVSAHVPSPEAPPAV